MTEDELVERCHRLPEQYAARVSDDDLTGLRLTRDGGEWGGLVSLLVAGLANRASPVTSAERDELRALVRATGEGGQWVDRLTVRGGDA